MGNGNEPFLLATENQDVALLSSNNNKDSSITEENQDLSFKQTLKKLLLSTLPLTITTAVSFFNETITLHCLKFNSDIKVQGAYGLAGTVMNIFAMAVFISLNVGLTSKSAQAFGAKNYKLIGLYLHRGLIVNMILFIPFCCFFYWSNKICVLFGFEEQTSIYIQQYLSEAMPGLLANIIFSTLTAYLNACNVFTIPGIIEIIGCIVNWVGNYVLIERYQMGLRGAAMSWNLMFFVSFILMVVYLKFWNPIKGTLFWFCKDSFREIWSLFKHEAWIGSMIYLEWIAMEIELVLAGRLDQVQLTALPIAIVNLSLVYSIPISLADAVLTYMGNSVGEKKSRENQKVSQSWCCTLLLCGCSNRSLLLGLFKIYCSVLCG